MAIISSTGGEKPEHKAASVGYSEDALTTADSKPAHLRAPHGMRQSVHEANVILTAIIVSAYADYKWLNGPSPNTSAAKATAARLLMQAEQLQMLIDKLSTERQ